MDYQIEPQQATLDAMFEAPLNESPALASGEPREESPAGPVGETVDGSVNESVNESAPEDDEPALIQEDRVWQGQGWTARVIKNEDDDGWAVAMIMDGEPEPALVGPWTMGRDKKNPKPLDISAFHTLVKTANEVIRRHEQQLHARLHKSVRVVTEEGAAITVKCVITPDEDDPYATLTAVDEYGDELASVRTRPDFRLSVTSATDWIEGGYRKPL